MESNEQSHSGMESKHLCQNLVMIIDPVWSRTSVSDDEYQGEDEDETDNQSEIAVSSKTKLGMDTNTFNLSLKMYTSSDIRFTFI